jgi:Family of unknown function (DUF6152)
MKNRTSRACAVGIASFLLLGIAIPLAAHHSFAMYDTSVEKTMTGKLVRFIIGANHSQYVMEVLNADGSAMKDDNGKPLAWTIETTSAAQLERQNITVETFKIGTIFTLSFSPLRDGRNGGAQRSSSLVMCGMTMPAGGCNDKTGKKY